MTRQIRDRLIYEEQEYHLDVELLEQYFRAFPEKRPKHDICCSALWRGYVAVFEIRNHELLIKEFDWLTDMDFNMKSFKDELFPNNKLEWYSGLIRIDRFRGDFYEEPKDGIFEYLEIVEGNFVQKRVFNYEALQAFKRAQYEYFMLSDELEELYDFWRSLHTDGVFDKERMRKSILDNIMEFTKVVYVS